MGAVPVGLPEGPIGGVDVDRLVGLQVGGEDAIGIDFVEMVVWFIVRAIGEEDLMPIIVDLRVADAAAGVVDQCGHRAGGEVQSAESAPSP